MRSLNAIEQSPELAGSPLREQILLVGSVTLGLYKEMLGIPPEQHHIHIDDLDICVPKIMHVSLEHAGWKPNNYRGIYTLRRSFDVQGLLRPVEIDAGTAIGELSHADAIVHSFPYKGHRLLEPQTQLAWYESLGRKKDLRKIEILKNVILPAFAKK